MFKYQFGEMMDLNFILDTHIYDSMSKILSYLFQIWSCKKRKHHESKWFTGLIHNC